MAHTVYSVISYFHTKNILHEKHMIKKVVTDTASKGVCFRFV